MAKVKQLVFSKPLLPNSATISSAAAASAASKIKSNFSTVTKLPKALKRTPSGATSKDPPDCVLSPSRSSTTSSLEGEAKANNSGKFGISSLMHIRTNFMEKSNSKSTESSDFVDSPQSQRSNNDGGEEPAPSRQITSAIDSASRFVMGVPTLLRHAVTNNQLLNGAHASTTKSSNANASLTSHSDCSEDDQEENDRHSLLMMLQVPEATNALIPLMAVGEAWWK